MKTRALALITVLSIYIFATAIAVVSYFFILNNHNDFWFIILRLFISDIICTIVIYTFGLIFKNSSLYDPYWSLIPWLILIFMVIVFQYFNTINLILLVLFGFWSNRLTVNWAKSFDTLKVQDWRYVEYKKNNKPLMWHFLNFVGINLVPTILVFGGLIPLLLVIYSNLAFSWFHLIGLAVIVASTILELVADYQLSKFKKLLENKGKYMNQGLWKYSRHPNYLGEISMWFGGYLVMVVSLPNYWYLIAGAIAILILFIFVSIPLMEKRQIKNKLGYSDYQKNTSMLLILPPKKKD
jgi:steroid 5-alpha reductase family enzyme